MAKKALVSTLEPSGKDNSGYRVLEVVDAVNTFDTHPTLQWHDCGDMVKTDQYWFDPATNTFKILPEGVEMSTAGELAVDADGNPTERYEWSWDTESWSKVAI